MNLADVRRASGSRARRPQAHRPRLGLGPRQDRPAAATRAQGERSGTQAPPPASRAARCRSTAACPKKGFTQRTRSARDYTSSTSASSRRLRGRRDGRPRRRSAARTSSAKARSSRSSATASSRRLHVTADAAQREREAEDRGAPAAPSRRSTARRDRKPRPPPRVKSPRRRRPRRRRRRRRLGGGQGQEAEGPGRRRGPRSPRAKEAEGPRAPARRPRTARRDEPAMIGCIANLFRVPEIRTRLLITSASCCRLPDRLRTSRSPGIDLGAPQAVARARRGRQTRSCACSSLLSGGGAADVRALQPRDHAVHQREHHLQPAGEGGPGARDDREGRRAGQRKINQWTRLATVPLAHRPGASIVVSTRSPTARSTATAHDCCSRTGSASALRRRASR